jgi:hypothetical protein
MKKTMDLDFKEYPPKGLYREQRLQAIKDRFVDAYKPVGKFIVKQIFKGNKEPKKMLIQLEMLGGAPLRRKILTTIGKGSMDKIKKHHRYHVISKTFLDVYRVIGELCINRIYRGKREPKRIVVRVEVK